MGGLLGGWPWRTGFPPVVLLAVAAQDPIKGRLGGEVDSPVGQLDNDLGRWLGGVLRQIALAQYFRAFLRAESVAGNGPDGPGPAVGIVPMVSPPPLEGAFTEAEHGCAPGLAGSFVHSFVYQGEDSSAIRATGQASSPSRIASTFFGSTRRAATSARA